MDTWVWDQVGLELVEIDVEGTVESEGGGDGRNDLGNESVEVLEVWTLDVEGTTADVVDGLVVDHAGTIGLLEGGVGGQDGVVWLDDGGGDLWGWVDGELELALLSVVDGEALHEEGTETGTSSTTERVEDEETLETGAVVGNTADLVKDLVDELLSDGVMTTGIVVGRVLLASDHLLGMEQAAVGTSSDLIDNVWLQIDVDGSWDILALTGLREECAESLVLRTGLSLLSEVSIRLNTVLQAVKLPARVGDLHTGLTDVQGDDFSHFDGIVM